MRQRNARVLAKLQKKEFAQKRHFLKTPPCIPSPRCPPLGSFRTLHCMNAQREKGVLWGRGCIPSPFAGRRIAVAARGVEELPIIILHTHSLKLKMALVVHHYLILCFILLGVAGSPQRVALQKRVGGCQGHICSGFAWYPAHDPRTRYSSSFTVPGLPANKSAFESITYYIVSADVQ